MQRSYPTGMEVYLLVMCKDVLGGATFELLLIRFLKYIGYPLVVLKELVTPEFILVLVAFILKHCV